MADVLSSSLSGLLAYRRALDTIGHNIANANTEGYTRQRVEIGARPPQQMGNGYVGNGVQVTSIQRVYDEYLTGEVWTSTSASNRAQTYHELSSRIDNLLADPNAGLGPSLESFFASVNEVADDPTSHAARQVMLSEGESLVGRFQYLDQRLGAMREGLDTQLSQNLNEINSIADSVAQLNKDIVQALGTSGGNPPNDLLDQRDNLIAKLAGFMDVSTVKQDDGSVNVFVGKGQALVMGGQAGSLALGNTEPVEIYYRFSTSAPTAVTEAMSGGTIGGILDFRDQVLDPAQNALGRIAIGVGTAFNAQHAEGMDLEGNLGSAFFQVAAPEVLSDLEAGSTAQLGVNITSVSALTTSDYQVDYDGSQWTLTRLSDGYQTSNGTGTFNLDGLNISLASGTAATGDSFLVRPTRRGAADIDTLLVDTRQIAAAAPIRSQANANNVGNAKIAAGEVLDVTDPSLLSTVTIEFTSANTYSINGAGSYAYTSGGNIDANGWRTQISGVPRTGDKFTVDSNAGGVGDNRNALLLADLRSVKTLAGGTADFQNAYGQMVADVGNQTRQADITRAAQEQRLQQAEEAWSAVSGVNLDEEAANLVRFQQAYQAAAQVVAVSNQLFQTLLQSFGR